MKKLLFILVLFSNGVFAQQMIKGGTIYTEHPYISVIRRLANYYGQVNPDDMAQLFADTAHFYGMTRYNPDTSRIAKNLPPAAKLIADAKKGWQDIINNWQDIKTVIVGRPEGFEYYGTSSFLVQSHWQITMVNKKTKKTAYVEMLVFDEFNDAGKIAVQRVYYDPTPLLIAMK